MDNHLIDIIVPIYNSYVDNMPVIRAVKNTSIQCKVHVCDNSDQEAYRTANKEYCVDACCVEYHDMGGNIGISKAYNYALTYCKGDIVCIFDDDTEVGSNYFEEVASQVSIHGYGVYVPIVVATGGRMLSPLNSFGPAIFPYRSISDYNPNKCFAFNTGMAITRSVFSRVQYNEDLFIEWVDHAFCRDAHNAGISFNLLNNVTLVQNFSRDTNNLEAALHREALAGPDLRVYYSETIFTRFYAIIYRLYRVLRSSITYRTMRFFKFF